MSVVRCIALTLGLVATDAFSGFRAAGVTPAGNIHHHADPLALDGGAAGARHRISLRDRQVAARLAPVRSLLEEQLLATFEKLDHTRALQGHRRALKREILHALSAGDAAAMLKVRQHVREVLRAGNATVAPDYAVEPPLSVESTDANNYLEDFINSSVIEEPLADPVCRTRLDEAADETAMTLPVTATVAAEGTPCVFGVVEEDGGRHCVHGSGSLSTLDWCYTKADRSEWGSCGDDCPLQSTALQLGIALDRVQGKLRNLLKSYSSGGNGAGGRA